MPGSRGTFGAKAGDLVRPDEMGVRASEGRMAGSPLLRDPSHLSFARRALAPHGGVSCEIQGRCTVLTGHVGGLRSPEESRLLAELRIHTAGSQDRCPHPIHRSPRLHPCVVGLKHTLDWQEGSGQHRWPQPRCPGPCLRLLCPPLPQPVPGPSLAVAFPSGLR